MGAVGSARLLVVGAAWRVAGVRAAGEALVTAAAAGDETERTVAGMLLVRAGDRSVPVLTEAILSGRAPAELVTILASIGSAGARTALARVSRAADVPPRTSSAAAEALHTLDEIRRRDRS